MPTFSMPPPPPPPVDPSQPAPTGQKPTSYDDAFRSREAHTKFADPCALAREVRTTRVPADSRWRRRGRRKRKLTVRPLDGQESMKCLDKNAYDKSKCTRVRACLPRQLLTFANEPPPERLLIQSG